MPVWPDMAIQFGLGFGTFLFFMIFFAIGQFGGGDLKLLGALALWLPITPLLNTLIIMALGGGLLTLVAYLAHKWSKKEGQVETPYGIAISIAGLFVIYQRYINHFA
jgi:prepilin peptidase CpaA